MTYSIIDWADLREAARKAGFRRLHRRGTKAYPGRSAYSRLAHHLDLTVSTSRVTIAHSSNAVPINA